ncbi:MAG: hypothetical protein Tsb0010_12240 [Parvularculaceae bacterium]
MINSDDVTRRGAVSAIIAAGAAGAGASQARAQSGERDELAATEWAASVAGAMAAIAAREDGGRFARVMAHGTMFAGLYAPRGEDRQTPHSRDEIYVVMSGEGEFVNDGERIRFAPGDILFVKAHKEHRFENFSDDFATWVIFWGPEGGESDAGPAGQE